jgi:hypothetical protein
MATYLSKSALAAHFHINPRTVDLWHSKGFITGYVGDEGIEYNLEAVELAMRMNPFSMRDGRKRGKQGRVVPKPVQAETVES